MNTREVALISIFSAIWASSQILVAPLTHLSTVHGVVQRFMGWFLMLVLAELIGRFGRVSLMAAIAAFITRLIRYSPALYIWTVGLGYALGGLAFDALFFLPLLKHLTRVRRTSYLVAASVASGVVASLPYLVYKLATLGFLPFLVWLPANLSREAVNIGLNVLGTLTAVPVTFKVRAGFQSIRVEVRT